MDEAGGLVGRFYRVLVESIHERAPAYLKGSFTVAEIYQSLVPYRTHRDQLALAIDEDYDDALLRLLAGEGEFLILESDPARKRIQKELKSRNPNVGIYRDFAAAEVRLDLDRLTDALEVSSAIEMPPGVVQAEAVEEGVLLVKESVRTSACPGCEELLPVRESMKFCPHCGINSLEAPCRSCGEVLDREWRFCVACGVPTED
jgi:RNA polymerase subunit RPABC4/transcription elongation factor Spt4